MRFLAAFLLAVMLSGAAFAAPKLATVEKNAAKITTQASEPAPAKGSGPPQFDVTTFPSQLFWLVVTFGTLYLLLSGAALPRIQQGMTARAGHIHNLLADARRLRDEAEQHKNDMSSAADSAYQKAHAMLNKAAMEAQEVANRRNHELEAVLQAKQKASEEKINTARANSMQSVHDAAHMLIPAIAQKFAGLRLSDRQISDALHDARGSNDNGHNKNDRQHTRGVA